MTANDRDDDRSAEPQPESEREPAGPVRDGPVDSRRPGAAARERMAEGDEEEAERYADSPGAGLAGALDELPEPNEPG